MLAIRRSFSRVDAILREACGTRFTAAVARIEYQGEPQFERAYGFTKTAGLGAPPETRSIVSVSGKAPNPAASNSIRGDGACGGSDGSPATLTRLRVAGGLSDPPPEAVTVDTLFDLASITKPFVTTLVLREIADGRLELDAPLVAFFPEWRGRPHEAITLRMLLAHNSGMNSGADYRELLDRDVVKFSLERDLVAAPGERVIYSDLGFIAIGELLQRVEARSLKALARPALFVPPARMRASIPATEDDGWRGRVQGYVHDEKAYLMGGTAGHAGLFGTAADVAWLAEQYFPGRAGHIVPAQLAREAISEQANDPVLRRGLGWALKTSDENSCGRYFSAETFGHTGFVGTCVWADPVRDLSGVLLTNAVYFGRNDIRDVRAAFYEALVEDLDLL